MAKINVNKTEVSIIKINDVDYISLTDMLKAKDGEFFFSNWLRNRNTVEFLGIWEKVNNPDFNCAEFDIIKSQAGLNSYRLSAKEWSEKTGAEIISFESSIQLENYLYRENVSPFNFLKGTFFAPNFSMQILLDSKKLYKADIKV